MRRKFILIVICLSVIMMVFGLPSNVDYFRTVEAFSSVNTPASLLIDDFATMGVAIFATRQHFQGANDINVQAGYDEMVGYYIQVVATYYGEEWYETVYESETFYLSSERNQELVVSIIEPLISVTPVDYEDEATWVDSIVDRLQFVAYSFQLIIAIGSFVFLIASDTVITVLGLFTAFLRLIGLL